MKSPLSELCGSLLPLCAFSSPLHNIDKLGSCVTSGATQRSIAPDISTPKKDNRKQKHLNLQRADRYIQLSAKKKLQSAFPCFHFKISSLPFSSLSRSCWGMLGKLTTLTRFQNITGNVLLITHDVSRWEKQEKHGTMSEC